MNASTIARAIRRASFVFAFALVAAAPLFAQGTATIVGTVYDIQGQPVPDATVTLRELRRSVAVKPDGTFRFEGVRPGHYHVQAESTRLGSAIGEADVAAGVTRTVEIVLDPAVHAEEIVVSASPEGRRASEVYQPVNVVGEEELSAQLQPTIGETLAQEPGVNSTYFGPGSSRPIIRGLGSDRIRVLEEGVGTGDASNISPDHAVSVDPANAEQIEIVRGPATLLYGSNAVGGVVNILDNRIPDIVPTQAVSGRVDLRGNTVADEKTGSVSLNGGRNRLAWHLDLLSRDTGDYEIPGAADAHDDDPDELTGFLANSSLEAQSATLGASYVGDRGYFGLAVAGFTTNYGVPGHAHHEGEEEEAHDGVRIDLDQRRLDLKGELVELGIFRNVRVRIGTSDYEHRELEGEEVGTRFTNEGFEGRVEAAHRQFGAFRGTVGVQFTSNDFAAIGEEAFIPANVTSSRAVFAFEELTRGRWDYQFGGRFESQDVNVDDTTTRDRSFHGLSGSVGTLFRPIPGYGIAFSLARAVRLPTATELYSNGAHAATAQFEVGDPNLEEETSLGIDLSLRKTEGRFRAELNVFQNYFDGYIYEEPTGEERDDFAVFQFVQADARFRGIELDTHTELWHAGANHLELELGTDFVRATLANGGDNLPRIPPMRFSIGLRFEGGPLSAMVEARRYFDQDDVADYETTTEGYTLVNATVGYRFIASKTIHDVMLRGTNLTDQLARVHTSPLKERAPLPGRDFTLSYRVTF